MKSRSRENGGGFLCDDNRGRYFFRFFNQSCTLLKIVCQST